MKKLQIGGLGKSGISKLVKPGKKTLIAGGAVVAVAVIAVALVPSLRESVACDTAADVQFSPGGKFRAQKLEKTCHWGISPKSDRVQVLVDRQSQDGWSLKVPLDPDGSGNLPEPAGANIKWKGASTLDVTIYSADVSGGLVRHFEDLTVTSHYVKLKAKGGDA